MSKLYLDALEPPDEVVRAMVELMRLRSSESYRNDQQLLEHYGAEVLGEAITRLETNKAA